ncbi:SRPBCC family protein [Nocardioides yefusunii]|uniref:SRPBCC family protein n=1 Tax=Nocardioides yefusunii TaxID=2500546 RepID=A0ABW1R224_9ACTN|nr:SRPBCC family protein [Nocardioides yefusunii]
MPSRHVSEVIRLAPALVYAWTRDTAHLPLWASGLASAPGRRDGHDFVVRSPMGEVRVRFTPRNEYGVLDHTVTLPDGTQVLNPVRVIAHPEGAEIVFTVRQLGSSDAQSAADVATVTADLRRLKELLEA